MAGGSWKFRPDQPRVPAGTPDGGQWTSEGGDGSGDAGDTSLAATIHVTNPKPGDEAQPPGEQSAAPPEVPFNQTPPVISIAERPLTGPGHHMLTNQTAREIGNFSKDALSVFDESFSNGGWRIPVEGHGNSKEHFEYNRRLTPFVRDWLNGNNSYGHKIDPNAMTTQEAKELLKAMNRDPALRQFNQSIYSKGIFQSLGRLPRRNAE